MTVGRLGAPVPNLLTSTKGQQKCWLFCFISKLNYCRDVAAGRLGAPVPNLLTSTKGQLKCWLFSFNSGHTL
jgi:hypothetical protein